MNETQKIRVKIRPVSLPDGPRGTMARLRRTGRFALLESALVAPGRGDWSFIAGPQQATLYTGGGHTRLLRGGEEVAAWPDPFDALQEMAYPVADVRLDGERPPGLDFVGGWVGLLGYDLARRIERIPQRTKDDPVLPQAWWMAVDQVLAFEHASGRWWHATVSGPGTCWPWYGPEREAVWAHTLACAAAAPPPRTGWQAGPRRCTMGRPAFEAGVEHIRRVIAAGEVMQVNLTRREEASFSGDAWSLYEDLVALHPAPFSAFIETPDFAVASCSPERFLRLRGREVEAWPMKGTLARGADPQSDAAQRLRLQTSGKDRAENLMIVDLMRNDLGRVAETGSVQVPDLFSLQPYASVWQMVSVVRARLRADRGVAALLRACWPPGSMTGAPKVKAMEIIERLEPLRRGFYAGSAGYIDCTGNMDLSVLIRTAIAAGGRVMLQLGGGIVADSDPAHEWQETVDKGLLLTRVLDRRCG